MLHTLLYFRGVVVDYWGLFSLKNHFELSFVFILVTGVLINVTRLKLKLASIYPLLLSNDCIHILLFCVLYFFSAHKKTQPSSILLALFVYHEH